MDIKKSAFIFPGQGSQTVGMGSGLNSSFDTAKELFMRANQILGMDITEIMWNGPEKDLSDTIYTQPALFIHSMAAYRVFQNIFPTITPQMLAGHSLGQLSACAASGAISFEDGLLLVRKRGELMKRAGEINPGGMAAILGVDIATLDKVCANASMDGEIVQVANDNCPGQVVISGHKSALERAILGAKAAGAKRALPLAVSIAAHSPLMDSIQAEWGAAVDSASFSDALVPVVGNVNALPVNKASDIRFEIKAQMQSRVRWTESVTWMNNEGVISFVEVGNGSVLSGLVKRIGEGVSCFPLGNPLDFENLK